MEDYQARADAILELPVATSESPVTVVIQPHHLDALKQYGKACVWGTTEEHDGRVGVDIVIGDAQ